MGGHGWSWLVLVADLVSPPKAEKGSGNGVGERESLAYGGPGSPLLFSGLPLV